MLSVIEHALVGIHALPLRLVVVVEDLLVDLACHTARFGVLVFDGAEFQECVRIADGFFELMCVSVRAILGGGVRDLHQLLPVLPRGVPMLQDSIDDFARMMAARE